MTAVFCELPDGTEINRVVLTGGGLTASVLTYGALLQDLRLEGHESPLVLGFPEFAPYLDRSPYFGAIAGRCANRVRDGHLEIEGQTFALDRNFLGKHMLHGGAESMGKSAWRIGDLTDDSVTLKIAVPDGHMGFPGNLDARVTYSLLPGGTFDIRFNATTDAPTLCNLAHHSYFNLDGGATISDHLLWVDAEHYLPVDDELIPTGEVAPVAGTAFDFRQPAPVRQAHKVDHNYCLSNRRFALRPVARLTSPASGVAMECRTTEPGLQIYDGAKINIDLPGLDGQPMGAFAGLAMEPQIWPDANHNDGFPSAVLRPGETYEQHTQFIFSKEKP